MFLLIMIISSALSDMYPQNTNTKPTRQSSFEAYSKGNFEQAYYEFGVLLQTYSKDPLYKYYSGVCLVKLNRNPDEAVTLLREALQSAAIVKTLPSDALFYLGRAQQLSGKFSDAVGSFQIFTEQAGKKTARELGVQGFIEECKAEKGKITESEDRKNVAEKGTTIIAVKTEEKEVVNEVLQTPPGKIITVKESLPSAYEKVLDDAVGLQYKSDSVKRLADRQKEEIGKLTNEEKTLVKSKISDNELLAVSLQKSADQKYNEAKLFLNPEPEKVSPKEIPPIVHKTPIVDSVKESAKVTFLKSMDGVDSKSVNATTVRSDTLRKRDADVKIPAVTFAYFEVSNQVPGVNEKIMVDPETPSGLIYRIQLAVFRNPVSPSYFMGIKPVFGFRVSGTDKTNYYAGMFRRLSEAKKALLTVKAKGFKDSFIVALVDNKPVSADRAVVMEKEWGRKPFVSPSVKIAEMTLDTIPPTLTFRVEVTRSLSPLKDDVIGGIEKMAGSRGLDIQIIDDSNIVYMIGKFITFESAEEYANLLIKNGYREAHVVAWLGKREIPVETAKQLFDDMK